MPAFQLEPGEMGHQVELSGPDIAVRAAEESGILAVIELKVVGDDPLPRHTVGVQADVARLRMAHGGLLARRKLAQLRHPQLDHEVAAGCQVTCRVAEAGHLL